MTERSLSYIDFFPYPDLRPGQEDMMASIGEAVGSGRDICCEAPNGFGKTCVTLCGILPWIKQKHGKILYCARTHRQLDRVIEELSEIGKKQDVSGISLRGRRHMCLNTFVLENADYIAPIGEVCGQLKATRKCKYYEALRDAGPPEDLLEDLPKRVLTAPEIVDIAKKRKICPYELAKQLAKVVDVLAMSYLYVFNPWILDLTLPELEVPPSRMVLVQDEAHNVPATALDSASDSLTVRSIGQAMREADTYFDSTSKKFAKALSRSLLDASAGLKEGEEIVVNPREIVESSIRSAGLASVDQVLGHMIERGSKIRKGLLKSGKFPKSSIHRVAEFLVRCLESSEREDVVFILASRGSYGGSRRVTLDLVALDPTSVTRPVLRLVHSSVAVSGTISPLDAYAEMLGFTDDAIKSSFQNPFARKNRLVLIVDKLDTKWRSRNDETYADMVEHCVAVAEATPGNTGIFAASYSVAKGLIQAGLGKRLGGRLFAEEPRTKTAQNDTMIAEFKRMGDNGGAVLLGVQGGRNSEGGDFPGASMESVVVVGVPYGRPTPRTEALINYYDTRFNKKGRDYAYVLPAMTRAIQAAGRPVRRMDDRGVIVMLDQRFGTGYLKRFMPSWLREVSHLVPNDSDVIRNYIEDFFNS
ncbi:MAG: helicase C-terminal domain-containing protein [Candidatus Thorarchaeota archaeon]